MRSWIGLFVATAMCFAIPASAQAQAGQAGQTDLVRPLEPEGLTFTPFLDFGFAGDYEETPLGFGAALGYGFANRVSVEGEFMFTPGAEMGIIDQFESTVWGFSGNVLYHFVANDFTPYVAAGLSALGADADADDLLLEQDTHWNLGLNWGAGIKAATSERFGFRGDLRYFNGDDLVPDHWRLYGGLVIRRIGQ